MVPSPAEDFDERLVMGKTTLARRGRKPTKIFWGGGMGGMGVMGGMGSMGGEEGEPPPAVALVHKLNL